ncbi:MAG: hypothetical protein QM813_23090 [Verrucomicrobiota bacterium]
MCWPPSANGSWICTARTIISRCCIRRSNWRFWTRSADWKRSAKLSENWCARRAELEAEKSGLIVDEKTYAQQLDLLRFQVKEIEAARLQAGRRRGVEQEHNRASNAAKLLQLSQAALEP